MFRAPTDAVLNILMSVNEAKGLGRRQVSAGSQFRAVARESIDIEVDGME